MQCMVSAKWVETRRATETPQSERRSPWTGEDEEESRMVSLRSQSMKKYKEGGRGTQEKKTTEGKMVNA